MFLTLALQVTVLHLVHNFWPKRKMLFQLFDQNLFNGIDLLTLGSGIRSTSWLWWMPLVDGPRFNICHRQQPKSAP